MKHGPIALIDEELPVVVIATGATASTRRCCSNIEEVRARDGQVIAVADRERDGARPASPTT